MLDLTFGEQVKIILSRKGMTIKELAEIIEERTGKKMSRQNLTQRLGRDNFQEQDMRMIADILGCPFQLSILADINEVERASNIEDVVPTAHELSRLVRAKERKAKKGETSDAAEVAATEETTSNDTIAPKVTESERDMTIGELVDIHVRLEELESLNKAVEEDVQEIEQSAEEMVAEFDSQAEEIFHEAERIEASEPVDEKVEFSEEVSAETEEALAEAVEESVENQEKIIEESTEETENFTEPSAEETENFTEESVETEETFDFMEENTEDTETIEEYAEEPVAETQETLQDENEEIQEQAVVQEAEPQPEPEKHEEKHEEKKARGWRAMFQRRPKKAKPEESRTVNKEPEVEEERNEWTENPVEQAAVVSGVRQEEPVMEEEVIEMMPGDSGEDEEDLERGDRNPYTGHEYETNSVRMHPKRIGYVQVYDRSNHQWTDMTEWAFLGYQERKKALLGKDYEPPIYLD